MHWIRIGGDDQQQYCTAPIPMYMMSSPPSPELRPSMELHGSIPPQILDRIPVEIFDHIIEQIPYPQLPTVALVARAWYASAVHNLYHILGLPSRAEYTSFIARLHASSRVQRWAMNTEELIIGEPFSKPAAATNVYLDSLPAGFARSMPHLRKLIIHSELRSDMHSSFYPCLKQFSNLVSLCLTDVQLRNIIPIRRVVCSFPALKALSLSRLKLANKATSTPQPLQPCRGSAPIIRLSSLTLDYMDAETLQDVADWLIPAGMCRRLDDFAVGVQGYFRVNPTKSGPTGRVIARFLKGCESHLKSFRQLNNSADTLGRQRHTSYLDIAC